MIKFCRISAICLLVLNIIYVLLTKDFEGGTLGITLSLVLQNTADIEELKK